MADGYQDLDKGNDTPLCHQKFAMLIGFLGALFLIGVFVAVYVPLRMMDDDDNEDDYDIYGYVDSIDAQSINTYLKGLQRVADNNNGNRAVGTSGYSGSVDYVVSQLRSNPICDTYVQHFSVKEFMSYATPTLSEVSPSEIPYQPSDFNLMQYSGGGNVTAVVIAPPGDRNGCDESEWQDNYTTPVIVVIQRGGCPFVEKVQNAARHNASGVLIYNEGVSDDTMGVFGGTLETLQDIPVFSIGHNFGVELLASDPLPTLNMFANTGIQETPTMNVLCVGKEGDANNTIVVGSHLDSVPAGPGINDNGSGSSLNLELANKLAEANLPIANRIIFAWWGAEEIGLKGSAHFVDDLVQNNNVTTVALNLNFDMIGSPNAFIGVYQGSAADEKIREGCTHIENLFIYYFDYHDLPWSYTPFTGRSDYGPFIAVDIPAGGLFTGAESDKSMSERTKFGGLASAAYDPCYHEICDTIDNIDLEYVQDNANAAAYTLASLATEVDLQTALGGASLNTMELAQSGAHKRVKSTRFPQFI